MKLSPKEKTLLQDLQKQEALCIEKYKFYAKQAKDEGLKDLFTTIGKTEKTHYESLGEVLNGKVPEVGNKKSQAASYQPTSNYKSGESQNKKHDEFLCTDSISTEKYVSSTYDNDLFHFSSIDIRELLNDIQTEEQNHAEMIYLYKSANNMTSN